MSMRLRQFTPLSKGNGPSTSVNMSGPRLVVFLLWTLASGLVLMAFDLVRIPVRAWREGRK